MIFACGGMRGIRPSHEGKLRKVFRHRIGWHGWSPLRGRFILVLTDSVGCIVCISHGGFQLKHLGQSFVSFAMLIMVVVSRVFVSQIQVH